MITKEHSQCQNPTGCPTQRSRLLNWKGFIYASVGVTFKADEVSVYVGWRHCMSLLARLLKLLAVICTARDGVTSRTKLEFGWNWTCASFVNTVTRSPWTLCSYSAHVLTLPRPPKNDSHARWHLPSWDRSGTVLVEESNHTNLLYILTGHSVC
jgi:hypothetical protein